MDCILSILELLEEGKISKQKAYKLIYKKKRVKKPKKSSFIKLSIKTNESKGVDRLLKVLFVFPIPIFIGLKILRKQLEGKGLDEIRNMQLYKGMYVKVKSSDRVLVHIRTI